MGGRGETLHLRGVYYAPPAPAANKGELMELWILSVVLVIVGAILLAYLAKLFVWLFDKHPQAILNVIIAGVYIWVVWVVHDLLTGVI